MPVTVSAVLTALRELTAGTYRTFRTSPAALRDRITYLTLADAIQRRFAGQPDAAMDAEDVLDLDFNGATGNLAVFLHRNRHARPGNRELCAALREMFFGGYGRYDRSEVEVRPIRHFGRSPEHAEPSFENAVRLCEDGR